MAKSKITDFKQFSQELSKANTEEDVKSIYAQLFGLKYNTKDKHDLYTPQVLFEFKYDVKFTTLKVLAKVLAQTLYYVHRLKYGFTDKPICPYLCLADKNEAILFKTIDWKHFYTDEKEQYDWDLAPSNPDAKLIEALSQTQLLRNTKVFDITNKQDFEVFFEKLQQILQGQISLESLDKKFITEDNFEDVFIYWNQIFGESVRNGFKTSRYFVSDIQKDNTIFIKEQSKAFFRIGSTGDIKEKKIFAKDYEYFWSIYERVSKPDIMRSILAKIDRLTDETMRRFHGEFFTPLKFAHKALEYIEKTLGKEWWKSGKYRLWDMAVGTGNLEYHLPTDALPYCYLSTLYKEDVEHCQKLFPQATLFQYDYLNDDVGNVFANGNLPFNLTWKLPEQLRKDLQDPNIEWIILINPPFATSQTAGTQGKQAKTDVSDTQIRKVMHKQNLGETSRELFSQFLFRIKQEFKGKKAHLGLFSKIKYINANNDQKLREDIFKFTFERGLMFSSANFSGTSRASQFPVGFLIWNLAKEQTIEKQKIILDVFDTEVQKVSQKQIKTEDREKHLSKWINRPAATLVFPPFGGSINVKADNKDVRDRIAKGFLASLMCKGNDLQNQNYTALLSGPYASAGALSVVPANFEQAMVVHAVRRLPKATWENDRDQFMQATKPIPKEFILDCTVWNLYSNSNETVAMRDVLYQKQSYQIDNHFFPFLKKDIQTWQISDIDIKTSLLAASDDRFVALWLQKQAFSAEAKAVLEAGKALWRFYFEHLSQLNSPKFKISTWDAGWWQIRNALADQNLGSELLENLKTKHKLLKDKLLTQVYGLGFLG